MHASIRTRHLCHIGLVHPFDCAEAFASKNGVVPSFFDGVGMGLGFTIALTVLGAVREILGTGKIFGLEVWPEDYGMLMFVLAPGAFIVLGYLIAIVNKLKKA